MSDSRPSDPTHRQLHELDGRLAALEDERAARRLFDGYARCFAALGAALVVMFFPIMDDNPVTDRFFELQIVLVVMLALAAFRTSPGNLGLGLAIAAVAGLMAELLAAKPGSSADPPLTATEGAGITALVLAAVLGIVHDIQLSKHRRRVAGH